MTGPRVLLPYRTPEEVRSNGLSSCVVPLREGRYPPLFCIHDGNFRAMVSLLRTDRTVYGVSYSCSDEVGSSLTVEDLAANHLLEILKLQPHGPYCLIGYSKGALIAYEMGVLLARRGHKIGLLALIDIYNPALFHDRTFRKRYRKDRIAKYWNNLMRGSFYKAAVDGSKLLKQKAKAILTRQAVRTPEMIVRAYSPKEFQGQAILFRVEKPMDGGAEFEQDPSLGWKDCVKGGVDVRFVAGTHGTVMDEPHVIDLATKLVPYLNY